MPFETNKEYHVGISPSDVKWYALGRGWKAEKSRNPAVALYSSPDAKQQIQVPQKGDERDIALMMSEVLRKLSEIENRQIEDVSQDLRHPFTDALRLRVKSRLAATCINEFDALILMLNNSQLQLVEAAILERSHSRDLGLHRHET